MNYVIGVRFQQDGKEFQYDAGIVAPSAGEYVIVETPKGIDLAEVTRGAHELESEEEGENLQLPRLVRIATSQDIQRATDNRERERDAYRICCQKITEHKLEMKLVSVEVLFDNSKILFYFTANGRVDFRGLVKDLASVFKTRIELRQIGVRDEARMLGGLGPCGRPICCGAFLSDFQPVSIKMAKEQNLSLNPTKISGVCGRLMCCLKYEQDQYEQTRKRMPRVGREVMTPDGAGVVSDLNIVRETVSVRIPSGDTTEVKEFSLEQISRPGIERRVPNEIGETATQKDVPEDKESAEMETPFTNGAHGEGEKDTVRALPDQKNREEDMPRNRKSRQFRDGGNGGKRRYDSRIASNEGEGDEESGTRKERSQRVPRHRKNDHPEERAGENPVEKNRPKREQKFGQPVRRENPNRQGVAPAPEAEERIEKQDFQNAPGMKDEQSGFADAGKKSVKSVSIPDTRAEKPASQKKRNSWADAVEQALKAADG